MNVIYSILIISKYGPKILITFVEQESEIKANNTQW